MAILSSYDWESDSWTQHHGDNLARQAFRAAVETVANQARAKLPELNTRVDKAVYMALNGAVSIDANGEGKIASQSNGSVEYLVGKGDCCGCKDHPKAPKHLCKHVLAYHIYKRASALAKQQLQALDTPADSAPTTPIVEIPVEIAPTVPVTHSEAPASCNTYVTIAGRKVQVTLRDSDEQRLLTRLEALLDRFPVEEEPDSAPTQPAEDWCPIHQVQMKERKGKYGPFYSHMTANGWCNGKKGK